MPSSSQSIGMIVTTITILLIIAGIVDADSNDSYKCSSGETVNKTMSYTTEDDMAGLIGELQKLAAKSPTWSAKFNVGGLEAIASCNYAGDIGECLACGWAEVELGLYCKGGKSNSIRNRVAHCKMNVHRA